MRVLCAIPTADRLFDDAMRTVFAQRDTGESAVDLFLPWTGYGDGARDSREIILDKYTAARRVALEGGYDALWCVESDMLIPPDALARLLATEAEVAYSLYCFRRPPWEWSAFIGMDTESMLGYALSGLPDRARRAIHEREVLETDGVAFGCTLIRRETLERVPFALHTEKQHGAGTDAAHYSHCDWYFALDCVDRGIRQVIDCGVVCGHITPHPAPSVLWPADHGILGGTNLYRFIPYGEEMAPFSEQTPEERYREWLCTPHDMQAHLPRLADLARGTCLELGTRYGASTAALLSGVREQGGRVWSVDSDQCSHLFDCDEWTFVQADSCDVASVEQAGLPDQIDLLLIDTLHTRAQVLRELDTWVPRICDGGMILLHDTEDVTGEPTEVAAAVQEWAVRTGYTLMRHRPGSYGLTEIQM